MERIPGGSESCLIHALAWAVVQSVATGQHPPSRYPVRPPPAVGPHRLSTRVRLPHRSSPPVRSPPCAVCVCVAVWPNAQNARMMADGGPRKIASQNWEAADACGVRRRYGRPTGRAANRPLTPGAGLLPITQAALDRDRENPWLQRITDARLHHGPAARVRRLLPVQ
jgi:hypothetical protein